MAIFNSYVSHYQRVHPCLNIFFSPVLQVFWDSSLKHLAWQVGTDAYTTARPFTGRFPVPSQNDASLLFRAVGKWFDQSWSLEIDGLTDGFCLPIMGVSGFPLNHVWEKCSMTIVRSPVEFGLLPAPVNLRPLDANLWVIRLGAGDGLIEGGWVVSSSHAWVYLRFHWIIISTLSMVPHYQS